MDRKYVVEESSVEIKVPSTPNPEDYYNILESEEDRAKRIDLARGEKCNE